MTPTKQSCAHSFLERVYRFSAFCFSVPLTICLVLLIVSMTLPSRLEMSLGDDPTIQFRMERHWITMCDHFANLDVIDAVETGKPMSPAVAMYRTADVGLCGFDFIRFDDGFMIWSVHFSLIFALCLFAACLGLCVRRSRRASRRNNLPWLKETTPD
jgi:hypothetical protein